LGKYIIKCYRCDLTRIVVSPVSQIATDDSEAWDAPRNAAWIAAWDAPRGAACIVTAIVMMDLISEEQFQILTEPFSEILVELGIAWEGK
jgi:hypothetical protein